MLVISRALTRAFTWYTMLNWYICYLKVKSVKLLLAILRLVWVPPVAIVCNKNISWLFFSSFILMTWIIFGIYLLILIVILYITMYTVTRTGVLISFKLMSSKLFLPEQLLISYDYYNNNVYYIYYIIYGMRPRCF